ncbi:MAG: cupin domain-containing protein [bacterium]|nr:cupin domain-containing protein [bacterium]
MPDNILNNITIPTEGELFETILKHKNISIERITSSDIIPYKEYIQEQDEWVLLLEGEALLEVDKKEVLLKKGDYLFIGSGIPHSVKRTQKATIWLAVHIF